MFTIYVTGKL
uniref:Uncharacterized protein n=1 Tax=Rhizophora mucronata TaxID=61149 RepID=A0A2P2NUA8_RHIMU